MSRRLPIRHPMPVGDVLAAVARGLGMEGHLKHLEVLRVWTKAVGPTAAGHARPVRLEGGRLLVHVTDSAWLHRLSLMRRDIVRTLNDFLGGAPVKEVRLRIGPVEGGAVPALQADRHELHSDAGAAEDPAFQAALAPIRALPCASVVARIMRRQAAVRRSR